LEDKSEFVIGHLLTDVIRTHGRAAALLATTVGRKGPSGFGFGGNEFVVRSVSPELKCECIFGGPGKGSLPTGYRLGGWSC